MCLLPSKSVIDNYGNSFLTSLTFDIQTFTSKRVLPSAGPRVGVVSEAVTLSGSSSLARLPSSAPPPPAKSRPPLIKVPPLGSSTNTSSFYSILTTSLSTHTTKPLTRRETPPQPRIAHHASDRERPQATSTFRTALRSHVGISVTHANER